MSANLQQSRVQDLTPVVDMAMAQREDENAVRIGYVVGGWPVLPLGEYVGQYYVGHHLLTRRQLIPIPGQYCGERDDRGLQDDDHRIFNQRLAHNGRVELYRRYKSAKECAGAINQTMKLNGFVVPESLVGLATEYSEEVKIGGQMVTVRNVDMSRVLEVYNAVLPTDPTSLVEFRQWFLSKEALKPKTGSIALAKLDKELKGRAEKLHEEFTTAANRTFEELTNYVNTLYADVTKYLRTGVGKSGLNGIEEELFREIGHALPEHNAADDAARVEAREVSGQAQANTMAMIDALVTDRRVAAEAQAEQNRQFMELAKNHQQLLAAMAAKPISDKEQ